MILLAGYLILVARNVLRGVQGQSRRLDLTSTSAKLFAGISTITLSHRAPELRSGDEEA